MIDIMHIALYEFLECPDETIRRNAMSILKTLPKSKYEKLHPNKAWTIKKKHHLSNTGK